MKKILNDILNEPITISSWLTGFLGVFFIRLILEALSNPTTIPKYQFSPEAIVHYILFWLTLTLGLILILSVFNKDYLKSAKLALFGMPAIWIAPILDIFISHGNGYYQSYIYDTGIRILYNFFTFFGPNLTSGATYGMRIEMLIVFIFIAVYLKKIEIKPIKIFLCLFLFYCFGFVLGSWPGIMYTISHPTQTPAETKVIYQYFYSITINSNLSHNAIHNVADFSSTAKYFDLMFSKFTTQLLFILCCLLGTILSWKLNKKNFLIIMGNIRWERVGSYLSLLVAGLGFAYINNLGKPLVILDVLGITCLLVSWLSLWMYAVHNNDIVDIEIDKISNKERPLVNGTIDQETMRQTGYIWLAAALLGAYCTGYLQFYMSLVYVFGSHIYSNPPLRLRKYPLIPSFIIGICSMATVLAGFFFISINKEILTFPILLSAGIVIMAGLAINVKDMKDVEGDKKNGVLTLPVILGDQAPKTIGAMFALSFLLVPYFLSAYILYIVAIPAAIFGYRLVTKKPFKEKPVFILRFIFLLSVAVIYGGAILFAV